MRRRAVLLFPLALLAAGHGFARQDRVVCGTTREKAKEELHLHRRAAKPRRELERRPGRPASFGAPALEAPAARATRDVGEIVVVEDRDGVVARRNEFNLDRRTVTFWPVAANAARYRFGVGENSYDLGAATAGTQIQGLGDDDARPLALPFTFPFFGATYNTVYVNSDGNLTFTAPDTASTARSLGRMTAGPPRIAGLFRDLDPSVSSRGVRVLSSAERFVVSWPEVPEYREQGIGPLQTFQIRLFPDGRIEFAYAGISTSSAVVGISPGRIQGSTSVVAFIEGSDREFSSTIAERFGGENEIDIVTVAQKFYEDHEDAYDYLVIFNSLGISAGEGALAYEVTVRSRTRGNGDEIVDTGAEYGSARRLQAVVNMGPLSQYRRDPNAPLDPNSPVPGRPLSRESTLGILGHEVGHLFLAYASIRDPQNPNSRPMLGRQAAHWSFVFNSEASLLEGNRIRDNGAGASPRFITTGNTEGYSPLDQYLMGFRAPDEVPPAFLVRNASVSGMRPPEQGVTFDGERIDVRVEDIIAAEGRRTPDHTVAQRRFRVAFLLVAPGGSGPRAADLEDLENIRRQFEAFYRAASSERAVIETTLKRSLRLSTAPAAGLLLGAETPVAVSLQRPAEAPLTISLRAQSGLVNAPSSVTIPAGSSQVSFQLVGRRAGVDELTAEPSDSRYETACSKLQVTSSVADLRLVVVSGDKQLAAPGRDLEPVVLRVVDVNELPYPGVRVRATVSPDGAVSPAVAVADDSGTVRFRWKAGSGSVNILTATLEGGGPSVTVTALGQPAIAAGGVVNAASFQPELSPGTLATIFGANLAGDARMSVSELPWPTTLAGVQVAINDSLAPLVMVSERQINFLIPAELKAGLAGLVVRTPAGASPPATIRLETVSPAIFFDVVTGRGAVLRRGEFFEIYATGLGPVRATAGGHQETELPPRVWIGDRLAEVTFSGLAPGYLGLYQVNARLPVGLPAGPQPLWLEIGGRKSNEVRVEIR